MQVLDRFAGAKARLDSSSASMNDVMEALHQLTTVRAVLGAKLSSGECTRPPTRALYWAAFMFVQAKRCLLLSAVDICPCSGAAPTCKVVRLLFAGLGKELLQILVLMPCGAHLWGAARRAVAPTSSCWLGARRAI